MTTGAENRPLPESPARQLTPRGFGEALAGGLARLVRPPRPMATPAFRIFAGWPERICAALVGLALVLFGMAYLDTPILRMAGRFEGWWGTVFTIATDMGRSDWILIPSGVALLALLALASPARSLADRVLLALAARFAFVFLAVGGSGLIISIVKRIIARGRPRFFDEFGALYFQFPSWSPHFASFPSGHSQTAFASALALAFLFPRWRLWLIGAAFVIAYSRVAVDAHYFTDIVVGSLWGAWFTLMTRELFARRGLVFTPGADRRPFALPWRRVRAAVAARLSRAG
ncbi:phosphatase PAP2 family protein [Phreatobacter sp.]|uniref:phosphatase PAP2 family protein n=1 Tax=Phreatobacter sp. TaxID=1966341 RepID=UPI003F711B4C